MAETVERRKRLTADEKRELGEMYARGDSLEDILNAFDIGEGSVYRTIAALNIPTRRQQIANRKRAETAAKLAARQARRNPPTPEDFVDTSQTAKPGEAVFDLRASQDAAVEDALQKAEAAQAKLDLEHTLTELATKERVIAAPPTLAVTVDGQGTVQTVQQVKRPTDVWEVRYTTSVLVEAESIEQAIAEVRKLSVIKRIYAVRLKSGPSTS